MKDLTDGKGADIIYDPVGGDVLMNPFVALTGAVGILVIGFSAGRISVSHPTTYQRFFCYRR